MAKNVNVGKSRFQTAAEKAAARKKEMHANILTESKNSPQREQTLPKGKHALDPKVVTITIRNASTDEDGLIGNVSLKMTEAQISLYNRLNPQSPIKAEDPKPRPRDKKFNPSKRRAKRPGAAPV